MGGYPEIAQGIYQSEIVHKKKCQNKEQCTEIEKMLNTYIDISDDFYKLFKKNSTDNVTKAELFEKMSQFPFWERNMLKGMQTRGCNGCRDLKMRYYTIPLHEICALLESAEKRFGSSAFNLEEYKEKLHTLSEKFLSFLEEFEAEVDSDIDTDIDSDESDDNDLSDDSTSGSGSWED